jgi:hypothetical protein
MKTLFIFTLITFSFFKLNAQRILTEDYSNANRFSVYQSNPLTLYLFERVKLEYRFDEKNACNIAGTRYWNVNIGYQIAGEYRRYHFFTEKNEFFYYGRLGFGEQFYENTPKKKVPFVYLTYGTGIGVHFNITNHFFLDLSGGIKFIEYDRFPLDVPFSFKYFGPAEIADFAFYFGFNL